MRKSQKGFDNFRTKDSKEISRRQALKLGGLLTLGGITSGAMIGCSPNASSTTNSPNQEWDEEKDIIVVGGGTGIYTALRSHELGLETLVLEKGESAGGSTLYSSSVVWAPNNEIMKQKGDDDSREEALAYIEAGSADTYLPELAEAFVDAINSAISKTIELTGIEWDYWEGGIDYRSSLPGGKTIGRSLVPVVAEGESTAGAFGSALIKSANAADIEIRTNSPITKLITRENDDNTIEVLGVEAQSGSEIVRIKARVSVVMATGGFDWNDDMLANYLRVPARYSWGVATAEGDGHKIAMRAGCDFRFMNDAWMSPGYKEQQEEAKEMKMARFATAITDYGKPGLIYVNKHGRRFTNECSNYDSLGRSFCSIENSFEPRGWQNLPAFAIADQTAVDSYGLAGGEPGVPGSCFIKYNSLEELAEALDINSENLAAEVARFNGNAEKGEDPDFGRGQDYFGQNYQRVDLELDGPFRTLAPLNTPPFWAAEVVPAMLGTMGGIKINAQSQAIDTDGKIISRLYAQGNCAGHGVGGAFYSAGGGTIGPAIAFGEIAVNDFQDMTAWE